MSSFPISPDISPEVALHFEDLTAGYDDASPAIVGIAGDLKTGQSLALIGPNGAGKTTLIRIVIGLLSPSTGIVQVFGKRPTEVRNLSAYVPQVETLDRNFPVSVLDVVLMGRYRSVGWLRRPGAADREIARDALEKVDLADKSGVSFGDLSGGQQQRCLLARAIAQQPKLLLLDEPFNGVDSTTTELLLELLQKMREEGMTVVMSTHDLVTARMACDMTCVLNRRQFSFGPTDVALTTGHLHQAFGAGAVLLDAGHHHEDK